MRMDCSPDDHTEHESDGQDELHITDWELIQDLEHFLHKLPRQRLIQLHSSKFGQAETKRPRSQGNEEHSNECLEKWQSFVQDMRTLLQNLEYARAACTALQDGQKVLRVLVRATKATDIKTFWDEGQCSRGHDCHMNDCCLRDEGCKCRLHLPPRVPVILSRRRTVVPWQVKVQCGQGQHWLTLDYTQERWFPGYLGHVSYSNTILRIDPEFSGAHQAAAFLYGWMPYPVWNLVHQYADETKGGWSYHIIMILQSSATNPDLALYIRRSYYDNDYKFIFPRMEWSGSKMRFGVDVSSDKDCGPFKEVSPDYEYDMHVRKDSNCWRQIADYRIQLMWATNKNSLMNVDPKSVY